MDFTRNSNQSTVAEMISGLLERDSQPEALWTALSEAGLFQMVLPDDLGGDGLGLPEAATVLTELGKAAAVGPVLATLGFGIIPLTRLAEPALIRDTVGSGRILTAALMEPGSPFPAEPKTKAVPDGDLMRVTGTKIAVPYAEQAYRILVPTSAGVVLVDPSAEGVRLVPTPSSSGDPEYAIEFDSAPGQFVTENIADLYRIAIAAIGAVADGLAAGAAALTASHLASRHQFGKPLATFQAVAGEIADVYVTARTIHVAAVSAVWQASQENPSRPGDSDVLAYWIAAELPAAMQACHHLHGGIGVDVTYPMHRYYSAAKDLARLVGGASYRLDLVGASIQREDVLESASVSSDATDESPFVELTADQQKLQHTLRTYFADLVSDEDAEIMMTERHGKTYRAIIERMGTDGWLGVGWPKEFGGHGFGDVEQSIFVNEAARADIPLPAVTLQTVGPTLQKYGTEVQKDKFLKSILAGEVHFAIGYTEPEAGTDLASLRTTAVRDGDEYIVNGQKIFTTGGHDADYVWLAVRTGPADSRHRGISMLIVDTTDPGYTWTPIITLDGAHHVNATYYNDVRVPVDMLVGEENAGWRLITTQLNHERVMLGPAGKIDGLYVHLRGWAQKHGVLDEPDVRRALGEIHATFRINELLNWQIASSTADAVDVADASATKVFATERIQRVGRLTEELIGRHGNPLDADTAKLMDWLDKQVKRNVVITFGGGVNEVMRELIATSGLGLPRVVR